MFLEGGGVVGADITEEEVAVHEVEEENDIPIIDVGFREMTLTGTGS